MNDPINGWARNGVNGVNGVVQAVVRAVLVAIALFFMAIAIPLFFLPFPLGLPLFLVSLLMLAATSKTAHLFITDMLKRHPFVWSKVRHVFDRFHKDKGEDKSGDGRDETGRS